jgi:hypothetical protein
LKYRPTSELDKALLEDWVLADDDHRDTTHPHFFLPQDRTNCFAVEDDKGPVFFVRAESVLRLHIQFAPKSEWRRLAKTIDLFAEQIKNDAKYSYKQIIFESTSPGLVKFLSKRGYRLSPNEWCLNL